MGDIYVRRSTGLFMCVIAGLSVVCVALSVALWKQNHLEGTGMTEPSSLPLQASTIKPASFSTENEELTTVQSKTSTNVPQQPWEKNLRIPETTIPHHYDLMLHPDLVKASFTGKVVITIGVTVPMDYIVTHIKEMNITSTSLSDPSGSVIQISEPFEYKPNEFWVVQPKKTLKPGNYSLAIEFNGLLKGHIVGLYMSEYTTKSGEKRAIATSKFQPTDARRAFPCFDEPSFKSTFKTTLVRPSNGNYIALSNMPIKNEIQDTPFEGLTTVEFETSVPMVTYLACFIVCDFQHTEMATREQKPFRVYATADQVNRTKYALSLGTHILNYFEKYFEEKYPLPKQDMIAIPDFVSGAMEHWGLITYRETNLLYDPEESSSYNKQRVATVVSHELAHMWFGNLVTLKWWDDLWLNEGFASYIEYKGVADYEKDWNMMDQFVINDLHSVLKIDQILSSHPIVQPVRHPDEITEIFDKISYSKGASVLRMLEDFVGAENFRLGVRDFLKRFKFGNAVTQDLWDELQKKSPAGLNVTRTMDTWTRQMGFPLLRISTNPSNESEILVSQERFLVDSSAKSREDSPFGYRWDVPVTFKSDVSERQLKWLMMDQNKLIVPKPAGAKWIKFNVDQFGYYRVMYEPRLWTQLTNLLKTDHQVLSRSDRANLIDDAFSVAASGLAQYGDAFAVLEYLANETDFVPWTAAYGHLRDLGHLLAGTPAFADFRAFVRGLVDKHVTRVGWDDIGSHTERRNRVMILSLACSNGHPACLSGAVEKFKAWVRDPSKKIEANLRSIAYIYGVQGTGETEWDTLFDRFQTELNAQEKIKMLKGLTSTKEPWILNRFLELAKNESIVRRQDFFSALSYAANNPVGLCKVWHFVRRNWDWMVEAFGLGNRYLGRTVRNVAYEFTAELELKELNDFFAENPEAGSGARARKQALEKVDQNIRWIATYAASIHKWLQEKSRKM